jgi:tetratricopeptide (TPR) repeat protein
MRFHVLVNAVVVATIAASAVAAQGLPRDTVTPTPFQASTRVANRLDSRGRYAEARAIFQRLIDSAATPRERAAAQRSMAMSYGFENNCAKAIEYEEKVIAYWKTREAEEPQNAFYQQGEMANEGARVCIDAVDLETAEKYYRLGTELGNKEPEPRTHPRSLWDYRLHHALARIAARRGKADEARFHVQSARRALDGDPKMAEDQERFYPYLVGYVALYTNDLATAEAELTKALAIRGNATDPFMHMLLAMTYEKMGDQAKAKELYTKAYAIGTGHNPPNAFARPFARKKLGLPVPDPEN